MVRYVTTCYREDFAVTVSTPNRPAAHSTAGRRWTIRPAVTCSENNINTSACKCRDQEMERMSKIISVPRRRADRKIEALMINTPAVANDQGIVLKPLSNGPIYKQARVG